MFSRSLHVQARRIVSTSLRRCVTIASGPASQRQLLPVGRAFVPSTRHYSAESALKASNDVSATTEHDDGRAERSSANRGSVASDESLTISQRKLGLADPEDSDAKFGEEDEQYEDGQSAEPKVTDTLFIGNLYPWTTKETLAETFSEWGRLIVRMKLTSAGQNRGYAHVAFGSKQISQKVMKLHARYPFVVDGQTLRINYAEHDNVETVLKNNIQQGPTPTLFIGNMPFDATIEDLHHMLGDFGKLTRVRIAVDREDRPRGFAHVDFEDSQDAQKVLDRQQTEIFALHNRTLWIAPARDTRSAPRSAARSDPEALAGKEASFRRPYPPSLTLWVGGMPEEATVEDVMEMFEGKTSVQGVRLSHYKDGRSRSFAHVDTESREEATRIMEEHKIEPLKLWGKRPVLLDFAPPVVKHNNPPHYVLYSPRLPGDEEVVRTLLGSHAVNIRDIRFHDRRVVDPELKPVFIEFHTTEQAEAARNELNGKSLESLSDKPVVPGQRLILEFARRPKAIPPFPDGTVDYGIQIPPEHDVRPPREH